MAAEPRTIRVNGRPRPLRSRVVRELLLELGQAPERAGIAVAVNGTLVPRGAWTAHELCPGDEVEIVGATQGG